MRTLLDQDAPGLANKLLSLSPGRRRKIFTKACLHASGPFNDLEGDARNLLENLKMNGTLSLEDVRVAESVAENADAKYLELQTRSVDETNMLKSFSQARLFTAMAIGFGGSQPEDFADAMYELFKSSDDPSAVIKVVEADFHSDQ